MRHQRRPDPFDLERSISRCSYPTGFTRPARAVQRELAKERAVVPRV